MKRTLVQLGVAAALFCSVLGCAKSSGVLSKYQPGKPEPRPEIPAPMREFRAAWVATVANIDWPSKSTLTTEEQQAEAIAILDHLVSLNMNAVILQARPSADALYASKYEPWSFFLTNEQGRAPEPYYDPLEFWVAEAHKRGIELHVWFNPYRALHPNQTNRGGEFSPDHIAVKRPDIVHKLADGTYWMDPASPEIRQRSIDVVMDVVKRYDVDGIHFDDYFYPYPSYNNGADFPDDALWNAYVAGGGKLSRGDWRREAVNTFVKDLYSEIKAEKKHVKFGMSPFGIYRPGYPASIKGFDQYDQLYADALLWLQAGWVDYYTPQLYWPTRQVPQSFPVLLGWWEENNTLNRNMWPGLAPYKDLENGGTETFTQIMISRGITQDAPGQVMFSMKSLFNEQVAETLRKGPYANEALVPPSPWLDAKAPKAPSGTVTKEGTNMVVSIKPQGEESAFRYIVYAQRGTAWEHHILNRDELTFTLQSGGTRTEVTTKNQGLEVETKEVPVTEITAILVSAVDRVGNESVQSILALPFN